ncbi:MAG: filamentous hemagglutinin N-terminal domain-containing protein [Nostocales cyanobacterium 94392]|nr:filamentous hemagglutinin N-terminal domain-containing protein [Nostocales cyanobacterium 94392]
MKINLRISLWYLPLLTLFTLTTTKVAAQIIPDNTLGSEKSVVTPLNSQVQRIDGGTIRGINLFHSFQDFNIREGNSVYFANPATINNIFTRVTGNNSSHLLGKLGVLGDANLYFFNPHGIIFGQNASLDIRGSFVASTTNSLIFPDHKKFSATNPEAAPLLSNYVAAPVGLQFEGMSGTISNAGNLQVGQDLTLAAGNLDLQNQIHAGRDLTLQATDTVKIRDSKDNPFIATAGGSLQITSLFLEDYWNKNRRDAESAEEGGKERLDIFALNHPNSGLFSGGDMVLQSEKQVGGDARFAAGGNFRIEKLDGSLGDLYSPYDPIIFAAGDVSLADYFGASLHILAGGSVTLGNVDILFADSADNTINPDNNTLFNNSDRIASLADVSLSDGTELIIDGSRKPSLDVRAGIDWSSFEGGVPANINTGFIIPNFNDTATSADINVGNINIFLPFTDGGKVFLSNQYRPNSSLSGNITVNGDIDTTDFADGGAVTVDSRGGISLKGNIDASSFSNSGKGGDITLLAEQDIALNPGVNIFSQGAVGGTITFNSGGNIFLTSSFIDNRSFNSTPKDITPQGGDINITANSLLLSEFSELNASTQGFANAGDVNVDISGRAKVDYSNIFSRVNLDGVGNAGNLNITVGSLEVTDGTNLQSRTRGQGNAGDINIVARDEVKFAGIRDGFIPIATSEVSNGAIGNAGDINITVTNGSVNIQDSAKLLTRTLGTGNAGNVNIDVSDSLKLDFADILTNVISQTGNQAGDINIKANSVEVLNGANLSTDTFGKGNAGNIHITATDKVKFDGVSSDGEFRSSVFAGVAFGAEGNGGNINIDTQLFEMSDRALVSISNNGIGNPGNISINAHTVSLNSSDISAIGSFGNAGNVEVQARDSVTLKQSNILSSVTSENGNGGNINIDAKSLLLTDGSLLGGFQTTDTTNAGSAGNISVKTDEFVTIDNISTISASAFTGSGGDILIETAKFSLQNGSRITAFVSGDQPASSFTINATDSVKLSGDDSFLSIDTLGNGDAGTLTINTGKLIVKDGASISSSAALTPGLSEEFGFPLPTGTGKAGNLEINARESVQIIGTTPDGFALSSLRSTGGGGDGGNIKITTPKLTVTDGAEITAITTGTGKGGTIQIDATSSVEVTGKHPVFNIIRSSITTNSGGSNLATGDAGNIQITTPKLTVSEQAQISALTRARGEGGTIEINSNSILLNNGAEITARTFGEKKAGKINLSANILEVSNGAQITTSTSSSGDAGNIILQVKDDITLTGEKTGIFANTAENSTGKGGKIDIDPVIVTVKDGATIAVNSLGIGIGGDIELQADTLNLDNGFINAKTRSNTGGNITLKVDDIILMFHNSQISTTAGDAQFGGNGGNIIINTPFIVAFPVKGEGNDITANAFTGNGGSVNINSQFLFGIESRNKPTFLNDITASSEFGLNGSVNINTPGIDPTRSLTNLPQERVNAEVSQNCQANRGGTKTEFYNIGTGGIPYNPDALHNAEPFINQDLIPLQLNGESKLSSENVNTQQLTFIRESLLCE